MVRLHRTEGYRVRIMDIVYILVLFYLLWKSWCYQERIDENEKEIKQLREELDYVYDDINELKQGLENDNLNDD